MRYFLICDDNDTLTGMRLAGITGVIATSKKDVESHIEAAIADEDIAVLLITERCAAMTEEKVVRIRLSAHRPLVVVIPGSGGGDGRQSITDIIRNAIGVKI